MSFIPPDEDEFIKKLLEDPKYFSRRNSITLICILARMNQVTCEEASKVVIEVDEKIQELWRNSK